MASKLNEELMATNLDIPDGEIKIEGKANPVYADAINVHNKKKKEVEKTLKDKKPELKKPFLGTKGNTTIMPKTPEMKKLKLSEEMFKGIREHMADAPEAYEGIFRVIDNMEHIINYISDLTEEELNYKNLKQSYDILEEAMDEFQEYLGELKPTVRESKKRRPVKESTAVLDRPRDKAIALQDKRNNKDIWSDIYNELCGDIKDLEAPHRKLKRPPTQRYDSYTVAPSHRDDSIRVNANEESELDFAKEVADTYGVEYRIIEHTSRFAPHKYEMRIYPGKSVVRESIDKKYIKPLKDKVNFCYSKEDLEDQGADLTGFSQRDIKRILDGGVTDSDIEKMFGGYSFVDDDFGIVDKRKAPHRKSNTQRRNDRMFKMFDDAKNRGLKESYTEVDTIECGEEVYRVVGGGFNTRDALVSVEDESGNRKRLSSGDVIEFYTWYDRKGNVVHEPHDFDESLNEAQCNYVDTYNGATIYECEGKYSADVPDYNGKYSHSKRVVADSVEELKKKIDDADRQYRKDLEYTNESVKKRSRRAAGKASFNEDLKVYKEVDLTTFDFWSGARDTVSYLTDDELRQLESILEEAYPEGLDETQLNDIFWFEDDWIAELLGYNSFEEIMERDNEE